MPGTDRSPDVEVVLSLARRAHRRPGACPSRSLSSGLMLAPTEAEELRAVAPTGVGRDFDLTAVSERRWWPGESNQSSCLSSQSYVR